MVCGTFKFKKIGLGLILQIDFPKPLMIQINEPVLSGTHCHRNTAPFQIIHHGNIACLRLHLHKFIAASSPSKPKRINTPIGYLTDLVEHILRFAVKKHVPLGVHFSDTLAGTHIGIAFLIQKPLSVNIILLQILKQTQTAPIRPA